MTTHSTQLHDASPTDPWPSAQRLEAYAGELRVNLARLVAIIFFYGRHLLDVYLWRGEPMRSSYHLGVTLVVVAWTLQVLFVHACLSRRRMPDALKYITTALDLLMVTLLGILLGNPRSALLLLFFPIIAAATLRLSLPLVYFTTLGAAAGYAIVLAYYAWYLIGYTKYYESPELRIPRSHQAIFILCLFTTGALGGQIIRQARRLVRGHPITIPGPQPDPSPQEAR